MSAAAPPLVLHVIHHLVTGGMENGLVNLIGTIPPAAFRHAIVCIEDFSDFRDRLTDPRVDVIALHRSRIGIWRLRRDFYRLCRRLWPAIVHTRNLSGLDALLPALLADLRALAAALGIAELAWLPGTRADIPAVLRAFDVFVLPSLNEGISNTILEAMATGLPVVATAVRQCRAGRRRCSGLPRAAGGHRGASRRARPLRRGPRATRSARTPRARSRSNASPCPRWSRATRRSTKN